MSSRIIPTGFQRGKENTNISLTLQKEIMNYISEERLAAGLSQSKLADMIGTSQTTISRWESNSAAPSLFELLKICNAMKIPFQEMLNGAVTNLSVKKTLNPESEQKRVATIMQEYLDTFNGDERFNLRDDNSEAHIKRLDNFQKRNYIAFFLHPPTIDHRRIDSLRIMTDTVDKRGFCLFKMYLNDNPEATYLGKIVSPPNTYYTYFYLMGGDPLERGMAIMFYPTTIFGGYRCGNGVLLSISRSMKCPAFQRIVIIDAENYQPDKLDVYIETMLKEDFPSSEFSVYNISDLQQKHEALYKKVFIENSDK